MIRKQKIGCNVYDCKYCDCKCDECKLKDIMICNCHGEGEKETTMCDSYEKK